MYKVAKVDITFNYVFHFEVPGKCLYLDPQNIPFAGTRKVCFERKVYFPDLCKNIVPKSKTKHVQSVVKYDACLDFLLMVCIYVIKSIFFKENPKVRNSGPNFQPML